MTNLHIHHRVGALVRATLLWLLLAVLTLPASAITKRDADEAYRKGNFQQAIDDYRELLHRGVSAELYYNLGNAYYRSDNLTQAILAYERASLLSPGDDDIRFNLQFARSKTIDKITPEGETVFATWYRSLVNFTSVDRWATVSVSSVVLALLLMLAYLFAPRLALRKVGFFGGVLFVLIFLCSTLFAWSQKRALESRTGAIIVTPCVSVRKTPVKNAQEAFVLHEGTRVDVTDASLPAWRGIRLADGREGWIPARQLEAI